MKSSIAALVLVLSGSLSACGSSAPAPSATPTANPDTALLTLAEVREPLAGFNTVVHHVPDSDQPTLACQGAGLESLGARVMARREFDGSPTNRRLVNLHVATAVLDFDSVAKARAAYATVRGWLTKCPATIKSKHIIRHHDRPRSTTYPNGVGLFANATAAAPEACTECDTGWSDGQAVALVDGKRLVLVSLGQIVDLQIGPGEELAALMARATARAAAAA